jgi:hypothetical protein
MLDIWPNYPIIIIENQFMSSRLSRVTNITAALEQHNRVCEINLRYVPSWALKAISAAMEESFPALTHLYLSSSRYDRNLPVLCDSFLGGFAPRLRFLTLDGIPFPALPNLLLSTHDLVDLRLFHIPQSGYISPEAMVTCLSTLTRLEELRLRFRSPRSHADRETRPPPLLTRIVLPALTFLSFKGDSEYLEDIVSRIDAPLLSQSRIRFFNQLVFDTPFLRHFISRTETFHKFHRARILFSTDAAAVLFHQDTSAESLELWISCKESDWQLSSLSVVCSSSVPPIPTLQRLEISDHGQHWYEDMEHFQWLEILSLFTSVKDLVISTDLVRVVAPALQQLARESVTGVLPALQNIFLDDLHLPIPIQDAIGQFIAARQLSGHPVNVLRRDGRTWDSEYVRWEVHDR